jgi:hypothetical protein
MDPEELSKLDEMLDRIRSMSISDGKTSVYNQIRLKADNREIYTPPTTHLVATIDDLTDVLDYGKPSDMEEDADDPIETTLPSVSAGKWTATSTYDVYMVDTPKSPPRRRRRHRRGNNGEPSVNDTTANNSDAEDGDAGNHEEEVQTSPVRNGTPDQPLGDSDPDDLFEGADDNYMPESEEDESLGTEDYIVPEDPLEQERFWRRLVTTAQSIKRKQQQLQANTDALNEKWVEVLSTEQDMEDRCHSVPKSYPRRRLLPEFDEELADDHDRPPRGRDRPR